MKKKLRVILSIIVVAIICIGATVIFYINNQDTDDVIMFRMSYATYGTTEMFEYVKGNFIDESGDIYSYQIPRNLVGGYNVNLNKITMKLLRKYEIEKKNELSVTDLVLIKSVNSVPDEYENGILEALADAPENFIIAFVEGKQKLLEANYKVNNTEQWKNIRSVLKENNFFKISKNL